MAAATSGRPRAPSVLARAAGVARALAPFYAANVLTLGRLAATPLVVLLLLAGRAEAAFWLFLAAAATDAADGFVAKRFNGASALGRVLDPLADKLFVGCTILTLAALGQAPAALAVLVIGRDVALALGTLLVRRRAGFRVEPLVVGKASTVAQLAFLGATIGGQAGITGLAALAVVLLPVAAALTLVSAVAYLGTGIGWARAGIARLR